MLNRKNRQTEIEDIVNTINEEPCETIEKKVIVWENTFIVSTGSTLLDLAISGGRIERGGIPCCILCEIYGPAGSGKTAILSEVGASAQLLGGDVKIMDPEARMDAEYAKIYDIKIFKENYHRPQTVTGVFELIQDNQWDQDKKGPRVALADSLAALTTDLEIDTGDKMGMRRAKEFSAGFRINARRISNMLFLCSNQERESDNGVITPGGRAIPYYASLRIRIKQVRKIEIEKKLVSGTNVKKIIGIESECTITKSTVDDPYRTAPVYIIFGYGIDDIRGNLQYLKDMKKTSGYVCPDGKSYLGMNQAIEHIESHDLVNVLKDETIKVWHEVEDLFKANRSRKKLR